MTTSGCEHKVLTVLQAKSLGAQSLATAAHVRVAAIYADQQHWQACQHALDTSAALSKAASGNVLLTLLQAEQLMVQATAACSQGAGAAACSHATAAVSTAQQALSSQHEEPTLPGSAADGLLARAHVTAATCAAACDQVSAAAQHCTAALQALRCSADAAAYTEDSACADSAPSLLLATVLALQAMLMVTEQPPRLTAPSGAELLSKAVMDAKGSAQEAASNVTSRGRAAGGSRGRGRGRKGRAAASTKAAQIEQEQQQQRMSRQQQKLQLLARAYMLSHAVPHRARSAAAVARTWPSSRIYSPMVSRISKQTYWVLNPAHAASSMSLKACVEFPV